MKRLFLMLLCATMLLTCSEDAPQVPLGTIAGSVADKTTGELIPTVSVKLSPSGKTTVTGSDGMFKFKDMTPDNYTVTATKEGYRSDSNKIAVVAGETSECHILIERIPAVITVNQDTLDFGNNYSTNTLSFNIVNNNYETLNWEMINNCGWITDVLPAEGTLAHGKTGTIIVKIDRELLSGGENVAVLVLSTSGNGSTEVTVKAVGIAKSKATLNILDVTNVSASKVTLNGEITSKGYPEYTERGFVYAEEEMPTVDKCIHRITVPVTDENKFFAQISDLVLGKTYYARAYAVNERGVAYSSNQISFVTVATPPSVVIKNISGMDVDNAAITFNGEITNVGDPEYTEKGFVYGLASNPTLADNKVLVGGNGIGSYNIEVKNLTLDKTYYVRAYVTNKQGTFYSSEEMNFKISTTLPNLSVFEASNLNINTRTATLNGKIINAGVPAYYERGFVYGLENNPTIENTKIRAAGSGIGEYSADISSLEIDKTYYVKAYAINEGGVNYSNEQQTFILKTVSPVVTVQTPSNLDLSRKSATLNGTVMNVGNPVYTEKGFVFGESPSPTIYDNKIAVNGSGTGVYSVPITNLELDKVLYVRAYAVNEQGVYYSEEQQVLTLKTTSPELTIMETTNLSYSKRSATLNGAVVDAGNPAYTEKGFVYGYSPSPTMSDHRVVAEGSGVGAYSVPVAELELDRMVYVRAYAVNEKGTCYSQEQHSFILKAVASEVTVQAPTNLDLSKKSAILNATVVNVGDPAYTERGFVYSSSPSPTINDKKIVVEGSGIGAYNVPIDNLELDKVLYVRAYVKGDVTYYSSETVNLILSSTAPVSEMISVSETSYSAKRAKFTGRVSTVGNPAYTKRGFVYGFNSNPIMENDNSAIVTGTGTDEFSINVSGLSVGQKYFVRVFTEQDGKYFYSNKELSFTLQPVAASVGNTTVSEIDVNSVKLTSYVTNIGDPEYIERGFVYNMDGNPSVDNNLGKVIAYGTGAGNFSLRLSNLTSDTQYYVCSYLVQNNNIYYGPETSFQTSKTLPVVNTNAATGIMYTSATLNATIVNVGEPVYNRRGFYYGTSSSPTSANSTTIIEDADTQGDFSKEITGLEEQRKYYYRAFVIQPGVAEPILGEVLSFTTKRHPVVETTGYTNISCSGTVENELNWSCVLTGSIEDGGDPAYTELGFVYGENSRPTVDDGGSVYITAKKIGNTLGFDAALSGLSTGTRYYIRAVAKTQLGYTYGEAIEFTPTVIAPAIRTYLATGKYDATVGWYAELMGLLAPVTLPGGAKYIGLPAATGLGFVYGLSSDPRIDDGSSIAVSYSAMQPVEGYYAYGVAVTGLTANKTYYVRTYAKTQLGYTYGEVLTFKTSN